MPCLRRCPITSAARILWPLPASLPVWPVGVLEERHPEIMIRGETNTPPFQFRTGQCDMGAAEVIAAPRSDRLSVRHLVERQTDPSESKEKTQVAKSIELPQSKDVSVERLRPIGICDQHRNR